MLKFYKFTRHGEEKETAINIENIAAVLPHEDTMTRIILNIPAVDGGSISFFIDKSPVVVVGELERLP